VNKKKTLVCPICGLVLENEESYNRDWYFCDPCGASFYTDEAIKEAWPVIYKLAENDS
jgi:hypothetical protein